MRSDLLFALAAGQRLSGVAGGHEDQHRDRDDGDEDRDEHFAHLGPQLHDARSGGHEQQREDAGQDQAVDAGRDGQRQDRMADLAQKTERKDACELKQILRKKSPFRVETIPPRFESNV